MCVYFSFGCDTEGFFFMTDLQGMLVLQDEINHLTQLTITKRQHLNLYLHPLYKS